MAQIHALLLAAADPMSTEEIMEELKISRGNANMNVRMLIDWGLVEKVLVAGERKEYFKAEKDMWKVSVRILAERRRRELEPVLQVLEEIKDIEDGDEDSLKAFKQTTGDIRKFARQTDKLLQKLGKTEGNWFFSAALKLFKR